MSNERGVALVTVIFVGAAMTVVTSVAAFGTIREFRAGSDDRRAAAAHAYAEAGIDRFLDYAKSGRLTFNDFYTAGCDGKAPLSLPVSVNNIGSGGGTFETKVQVFDPASSTAAGRFPPAACLKRPRTPHDALYVAIVSTGSHPAAKRILQQVVRVQAVGLPVGHYAKWMEAGGTPTMSQVSLVSETTIKGRDKIGFKGTDPYYVLSDFYPGTPESFWEAQGRTGSDRMPSAGHAVNGIYLKVNGTDPEFPSSDATMSTRNCTANRVIPVEGTVASQSLWDGDGTAASGTITGGCAGQNGFPPTSKFTEENRARVAPRKLDDRDHEILKQAAQKNGLYCNATTQTCTRAGQPIAWSMVWGANEVSPLFTAGLNNFIAYFEYTSGGELTNSIRWNAEVWGCETVPSKSVTIIVRRGGIDVESNPRINGALIVDGKFRYRGTPTINGTIMAQQIDISGGATFTLDDCWVRNMPGAFLGFTPTQWSEIDR